MILTPTLKRRGYEYLEQLDIEAVNHEIRATDEPIPDWEWDSIAAMVVAAAERWLAEDMDKTAILGIEEYFQFPEIGTHGIIDLTYQQDADWGGALSIVDWKTTKSGLDKDWDAREYNSMQWKQYMLKTGATVFHYRGIRRDGTTRNFQINRPEHLEQMVTTHYDALRKMQQGLVDCTVYPRNSPSACFAYGRSCDYLADCQNHTMPLYQVEPREFMSHSRSKQFLACPEQWRRDQNPLVTEERASGIDAAVGSAVHRGIASVWRQAAKLFQGVNIPIVTKANYIAEEID